MRESLVKRHPRKNFTLATKLPAQVLKTCDDHRRIFDKQLANCGVDFFDYYLIHNIGAATCKIAKRLNTIAFVQ